MDAYTNRELDQSFKRADERADEFHNVLMQRMDVFESNTSTALEQIRIQTTKTNGSVADLKMWQGYITGAIAVIGIVVLPAIGWVFLQVLNNSNHISVIQSQLKTK